MPSALGTIIPSAILGALGSGEEQRRRQDALAIQEALSRYRAETLGLDRERLEEEKRRNALQYGPAELEVPGLGKVSGPQWAIPSLIQAASAQQREVSPTELGALGAIRERIVNPQVGGMAEAEAAATRKAFPQFAGETSALNVDIPQDIRLPRTSVEKLFTEAGAQRKEVDIAAQKEKQGKANARYRQLYSTAISNNIPHAVADATAISQATQEFGIAPEREAFVGEPKAEPKMSLEDEYLKALQTSEAKRTGYERAVIKQYQTIKERERSPTLVDLAIRASQGDAAAKKALDTYQQADRRERDAAWSKAVTILSQARNMRAQEQGRLGKYFPDPVVEEVEIGRLANQLAVGTADPIVRQIVADMTSGFAPGAVPPTTVTPSAPPPASPSPVRPAVPAPPTPQPATPMSALPPAAAHSGRVVRDLGTGKRYRSDGARWMEIR